MSVLIKWDIKCQWRNNLEVLHCISIICWFNLLIEYQLIHEHWNCCDQKHDSVIYLFRVFDSTGNLKNKSHRNPGILKFVELKLLITISKYLKHIWKNQFRSDLILCLLFTIFFRSIPLLLTHPSFENIVSLRHKSQDGGLLKIEKGAWEGL